jgi:hypothetical protein
MVLDFTNKQEDIQADFQKYYGNTTLDRGTDPQKLYNLKFEVEASGVFTLEEVNRFAELFVIQKAPGQKISPLFTHIIQDRFLALTEEEKVNFRDALERYVYQYSFISQIISWIDPDLEKFYLFTKLLLKYLPPKKDTLPQEILDMVDMDKFRLQEQQNGSIVLSSGNTKLKNPSGDGHQRGGKQEKVELELIVKELNERFHFDFEDRDKVMRIVIPKLAKDQGLVAAFQTDNLETLRRQKFAQSLENAFIDSASDFYSVLNRMSAEPDFKRLLTEFALGEFKRGLQSPEAAIDSPIQGGTLEALSKRASVYVSQNFGPTVKWTAINSEVWSVISNHKNHEITLTDVDDVARMVPADSNEVLAVLALLSRPASGLLAMQYFTTEAHGAEKVSKEDVAKHLRAWWRDKKIDDDAWRAWAGKVVVKWSPATLNEDSK